MKNQSNREAIRHSLAHLLAAAVLKKYPNTKLGIGPTIDNGFYYDFLAPQAFTPEDLKEFQKTIKKFIGSNLSFSEEKISPEKAREIFADQQFKLELIDEFSKEGKELTLYKTGDIFTDLCRGGHVDNTSEIDADAFALTTIAGAYWRGDEKNPQLQRIYGIAFETKAELDAYRTMLEEAKKRDHRKLGPELGLFFFHETSPGMPYWLPKGVLIYNELIAFWRKEHAARGYHEIISPLLNKKELYITSGHYDHYWPEMFVADMGEGEAYGVKAMNCPNAMIVFGSQQRSYKDLPLRFSDTDTLHRYERSGTLNGLLRVREFRQDDAHCFIEEDKIEEEYGEIFKIVERFYSLFNLEYSFRMGTRPEQYMGDIETWNKAEEELKNILKKSGKDFTILEGDGAFYGPKIDILMKDVLGREWQMGTIQLDFQQPKRFDLSYTAADGSKKTPVAIHRVIYGSLERFIGIIIEHFAGAFPFWLSPIQVIVLQINDKNPDYINNITSALKEKNIRFEIDDRNESMGKKIRESEMQKIPFVLVIGDKEVAANHVALRQRGKGDLGAMTIESAIDKMLG